MPAPFSVLGIIASLPVSGRALRQCSLLLRLRGRAALTQRESAGLVGVSERSVQIWETGAGHPSPTTLQRLIAFYVSSGVLTGDRNEAAELWSAAAEEGARFKAAFDADWFGTLRGDTGAVPGYAGLRERREDWGEAPAVSVFYGRANETETLGQWLTSDGSRLVAVHGMGGIGKTALVAKVAEEVSTRFDGLFWRSLRSAPPCAEWLASAILFASEGQTLPPRSLDSRQRLLLELLRRGRYLLVLDNLETLLEPGAPDVRYRPGYEVYGEILQSMAEVAHQSCIIVTSREMPAELGRLTSQTGPVRAMRLGGLDEPAGRALLATKGLHGASDSWDALIRKYRGNALALQVVAETIATVFDGSIEHFLAADEAVFGDIRRVLDSQLSRLSPMERALLYWLVVEREPVNFDVLAADVGAGVPRHHLLEALEALGRRSLLELGDDKARFMLQPVILDYATERLITTACAEIMTGDLSLLVKQPLVKAQAPEYVRRSQERLIAAPLLARLAGSASSVEHRLVDLLARWRGRPEQEQGYGPGNVVNLLRLARGHLRGLDLSDLSLRQVDFAGVAMQDATLADARVTDAVFATQFGSATSVALSADGSSMVVGTITGEVQVWRLAHRTPVMLGHQLTGAPWDVAIRADGALAASCGADGTVLWSTQPDHAQRVLRNEGRESWRVAVSADGRIVASGAGDGTTRLWDTRTGQCLGDLMVHAGGVRGLALSADGQLLATGGAEGAVRVWDIHLGQQLHEFRGVNGEARALAMSHDGSTVACGDADGSVHVWSTSAAFLVRKLQGHAGPVRATSLTADGRVLASGGADHTIRIWDTRDGDCRAVLHDHSSEILGASLTANGQLAASVARDGEIRVWDVRRGWCLAALRGSVPALFEVALSADGARALAGGGDGHVRLWDTRDGRCMRDMAGHVDGVWAVALTQDARLAASGGVDGTIRLWNGSSGECVAVLHGHGAGVWSVSLTADGRLLASGGLDGTFRLWDTATSTCLRLQQCAVAGIRTVRLSGDGRILVTSEFDGTVRIWDMLTGECRGSLGLPNGRAGRAALSADGRIVALADLNGRVRLWETDGLACLRTIDAQPGGVRGVGLDGTARVLGTAGVDGSVGLWDTDDGRCLGVLEGHFGEVWDVALSEDGETAVSGGLDGSVRVWKTGGDGAALREMRTDRPYERMDITGLSGISDAERDSLLALGAIDRLHM